MVVRDVTVQLLQVDDRAELVPLLLRGYKEVAQELVPFWDCFPYGTLGQHALDLQVCCLLFQLAHFDTVWYLFLDWSIQ